MKKLVKWLLLLFWLFVIFMLSNQANSSIYTHNIVKDILPNTEIEWLIDLINFGLRKLAHLTEYLILSLLILNILNDYNLKYKYVTVVLLCFIFALTDEFHQMFIIGRTAQFKDVLIDTFGAAIGISLYYLKIKYKYNK